MQQDSNADKPRKNTRGLGGHWIESRKNAAGEIIRQTHVVSMYVPGEKPVTFRGKTLDEALERKREFEARMARGEISTTRQTTLQQVAEDEVQGRAITLADHVRYWLERRVAPSYSAVGGKRERGMQPTTHANYVYIAERFVYPSKIASVKFDNLDTSHAEAFWDEISKTPKGGKQVGYPMRYKTMVMLRTVVNYVILERPHSTRLRYNPFVYALKGQVKPTSEKKTAPNPEVLASIIETARGTDIELFNAIGLQFALRRQNLAALQEGDFDLDTRVLRVQRRVNRIKGYGLVIRGGLKTKSDDAVSIKPIPPTERDRFARLISEQRARNLRLYLKHQATWVGPKPGSPDAWLFPNTITGTVRDPNELYRSFKLAVKAAGAEGYTVHQLRHDCVSIGLASGRSTWEMSQIADHANTKITEEIYSHITTEHLTAAYSDVGNWLAANTRKDDEAATG